MTQIEQPNPYKELRKELISSYRKLGEILNNIDNILKRLQGETE